MTFGTISGISTGSFSYVNTGNLLIVSVSSTTNNVTEVTYGGVALTKAGDTTAQVRGRYNSMWALHNPALGSNTVAVSGGTSIYIRALCVEDVNDDIPYNAIATPTNGTGTSASISVTTTIDGAYVLATGLVGDNPSAGANTTRFDTADTYFTMWRSTNPVAPHGSLSINATWASSEQWALNAIAINPKINSPSNSPSSSPSSSPSTSPSSSPSTSPSTSPSPGYTDYTREANVVLPSNDNDLATAYSVQDVTDISTEDDVYVEQDASNEYAIHQYKDFIAENAAVFTWKGKTNEAGTWATIHLQIYNQLTDEWEDLDTNNTVAEDTKFTLTGTIADLTNYKNTEGVVSCRIYQLDV